MDRLMVLIGSFVVIIFIICLTYARYNDNASMTKMVENGVSPLEARCAVKGDSSRSCTILSSKSGK